MEQQRVFKESFLWLRVKNQKTHQKTHLVRYREREKSTFESFLFSFYFVPFCRVWDAGTPFVHIKKGGKEKKEKTLGRGIGRWDTLCPYTRESR
jgi:hypothetical protein